MIRIGQLEWGPLCFVLSAGSDWPVSYADRAYRSFFRPSGTENVGSCPFTLPLDIYCGAQPVPDSLPVFEAGKNWAVWTDGDSLVFCAGFHGHRNARFFCRTSSSLDSAELHVDGDVASAPLCFPLDQVLTWGMLSRVQGVLMHAALVEMNGRAVLLAGRSGAGKSTISAWCADRGYAIYNDDRAIVYHDGAQWMAAGTPWHGSGRFAENRKAPLDALFFLHQDTCNKIETLTAHQAHFEMLDVAAVPWFEDAWSDGTLQTLNALTDQVCCTRLHFTKSTSVVDLIESQGALAT